MSLEPFPSSLQSASTYIVTTSDDAPQSRMRDLVEQRRSSNLGDSPPGTQEYSPTDEHPGILSERIQEGSDDDDYRSDPYGYLTAEAASDVVADEGGND